MIWLFEKADGLLVISRENIIMGLTFSRHSSGIFGELPTGFFGHSEQNCPGW
jgi:hypothetical protein